MGRRLSAGEIAGCEREGFRAPPRPPRRALCALLLALLLAGCAASNAAADKDRPHGFYGGISAGVVVP